MKTLLLAALLAITTQNVHAKTLIISDIDDTIKATDVLGKKPQVVYNGVFSTKAFSGMSKLYNKMATGDTVVYYVSGSPKIIQIRVNDFLEDNNFPQRQNLVLKNKTSDDTYKFKTKTIRELIAKIRPDKMILIGDDTEFDSEVYKTISNENPGVVEAVYIHSIQNKAVPYTTFFSAVEIAASEIKEGRLDSSALANVVDGFINRTNHSDISIKNRYCPITGRAFIEELKLSMADQASIDLMNKTQAKIISNCK